MKRILTNKWFWIGVALLVLVGLILVFLFARELFKPLLWAVLIVGVVWILAEVGLRMWKKRKRKAFDEGLTAKEGIEDRKREWQGFQAELDKQKIDRYELPFYLLVGEPQSGKSVLLQNSDLHFPFGQNKLSGIGGTRGCDWWFTEEAVILDLAGRLFTHEGGVADQVEWEAFLDLLTSFRPICPANGILLVIPCDSLLTDSPDVARQKANKIQGALLTLAKKLDAQLPIYLVLTKADKLFGFAESVHRLDAAKRHEMFGWSRTADKVDLAFDLEETRAGFRDMVARARLLRGEMLSSARIPEALSEIDRMFAFPDELAALEEPLEIYLRRVFTDSGLSDRLTFRGIYLTSGLQSGVPIARVCAEALGGGGDADMQELEALFTKQRAYFIKDLVRTRVFGERGIVRPTKGRVLAAQRRALVGYGVSALIALVSVIGGAIYLLSDSKADVDELTKKALDMSKSAERAREWSLTDHLKVLSAINRAVDQERATSEEIFNSTRDELKRLYVAEFDTRVVPALRQAMKKHIGDRLEGKGPQSYDELKLAAECAVLMLGKSDFATGHAAELGELAVPQNEREIARGEEDPFTLRAAIDLRKDYSAEPSINPPGAMAPELEVLAKKALALFEDCLVPGRPYQPINELGFMLAWQGLERTHGKLSATGVTNDREVLKLSQDYADSWARLESCKLVMDAKTPVTWEIKRPHLELQMLEVGRVRDPLALLLAERSGIDHPNTEWLAKSMLRVFFDGKMARLEKNIDASEALHAKELASKLGEVAVRTLDDELEVPDGRLRDLIDVGLEHECRAGPNENWSLDTLGPELDASVRDLASSEVGRNVYVAKVREIGRRFSERYPSWSSVTAELTANSKPLPENEFAGELVARLVQARTALLQLDRSRTREFVAAIEKILIEHLSSLEKNWNSLRSASVQGVAPRIEPEVIDALAAVRGSGSFTSGPGLDQAAQRLEERYVQSRQDLMLDFWRALPPEGEATLEMARVLDRHFALMKERFGKPDNDGDDGLDSAWLEEVQAVLVDRLEDHERAARRYWT
ncbi:MAG: type VI secretion protein IcmF/TssM N-terminal domain-containing protein, partial [Planctomycetota bacterium]